MRALLGIWVALLAGASDAAAAVQAPAPGSLAEPDVVTPVEKSMRPRPAQAMDEPGTRRSRSASSEPLSGDRAQIPETARLQTRSGRLSMSFEPNLGQTADEVRYLARGQGYTLFLTDTEAVLALRPSRARANASGSQPLQGPDRSENGHPGEGRGLAGGQDVPDATADATYGHRPDQAQGAVVRMRLEGATHKAAPRIEGVERLVGVSNYFIGNDPAKWHADIPHYARVRYEGVYAGIDLVYYGNPRQLEYDFVLAPGADPGQIQIAFEGAESLRVADNGDLVLEVSGGELVQRAPKVYQVIDGRRRELAGGYTLSGSEREEKLAFAAGAGSTQPLVGFQVAGLDPRWPLIVDPVLAYSTYFGGSGGYLESGESIAVDGSGNAYVTGATESVDFPTVNALYPSFAAGLRDAFIVKLNADGSAAVYSTYLGGSGNDAGYAIAADDSGNVYVTGQTASSNFPIVSALYPDFAGAGFFPNDAFIFKLDASGSVVTYSTYLGGSRSDAGYGIAVDGSGDVYVTGNTSSDDFPTVNALFPSYAGGTLSSDAFIFKLTADGSAAAYSTYLGGSGSDKGLGIAVDGSENAYVTGQTASSDFPTLNALFPSYAGGTLLGDAFIFKLDASGTAATYSTYLGGGGDDKGSGIAVDGDGNAYVTGLTASEDFPTENALYPQLPGGLPSAFVFKLNADGSAAVYSTYLGGQAIEEGSAIAVDAAGNAYVTGNTLSPDFPIVNPVDFTCLLNLLDQDAFVFKLDASGTTVISSGCFGGSNTDNAQGIAVDDSGNVYLVGTTYSSDFPTASPLYPSLWGDADAFVTKIGFPDQGEECPATITLESPTGMVAASDGADTLSLLRRFRDRVLSRSPQGQWMLDAYYRHGAEVSARLVADPALRRQALGLLGVVRAHLESALETGQLRLGAAARASIRGFAGELIEGASSGLAADLQWFLENASLEVASGRVGRSLPDNGK